MAQGEVELLLDEAAEQTEFESTAQELSYLRNRCFLLRTALKGTCDILEEYRVESKEYEDELVAHLDGTEEQNKQLKHTVDILELELEHWKTKCSNIRNEMTRSTDMLQRELQDLRLEHQQYKFKARMLEQDNDDLERSRREIETTRQDMEHQIKTLKERNNFLEQEAQVKKHLTDVVQRLTDEMQEHKLEKSILKMKLDEYEATKLQRERWRSALSKTLSKNEITSWGSDGKQATRAVKTMLDRVKQLEDRLSQFKKDQQDKLQRKPSMNEQLNRRSIYDQQFQQLQHSLEGRKSSENNKELMKQFMEKHVEDKVRERLASRRSISSEGGGGGEVSGASSTESFHKSLPPRSGKTRRV